MKEVIAMADKTTKLPESLTLKLQYTITLEEMTEYLEIPLEEITFQLMLDKLREYAENALDYNAIQTADVFDQDNDLVAGYN